MAHDCNQDIHQVDRQKFLVSLPEHAHTVREGGDHAGMYGKRRSIPIKERAKLAVSPV